MAIAAISAVAEKIIDRAEKVMFCPSMGCNNGGHWLSAAGRARGSSVAILPILCHKPTFIARLIKGCRVDVRAGCLASEIAKHFQRSNEHFSRPNAFTGAFVLRPQESQMPKLKTKSGAKSASR